MPLIDDLKNFTANTFRDQWKMRKGYTVPEPSKLNANNDLVHFEKATVIYADLSGSTKMVDEEDWWVSAEIYKTYLYCASRIIRNEGGTITSYDGDRVMGLFLGNSQWSDAARCGLKINYAVVKILNPAYQNVYSNGFKIKHTVGVDTSEIRAAKTGVRGDNDLVWVGRASNYAAKLTDLSADYPVRITEEVFDELDDTSKYGGKLKKLMWEKKYWEPMNYMPIYRSRWTWKI